MLPVRLARLLYRQALSGSTSGAGHHPAPLHGRRKAHCCAARNKPAGIDWSDNPDLDELVLDDSYYKELGLTPRDRDAEQLWDAGDVDPQGFDLDLNDLSQLDSRIPDELRQRIQDVEVYGPEAVVLAGFRVEEYAMVRALLDSVGGSAIKVLPATEAMLQATVDEAIWSDEFDWTQPRPVDWIYGGGWGAQRTMMYSGMSIKAQATLLELLESQGLPPICVTMAVAEDAGRRLGEVLAEAVREQRAGQRQLGKQSPWESLVAEGRRVDTARGLEPVDRVIGPQLAQRRLQQLQQAPLAADQDDMDADSLQRWFDSAESMGGEAAVQYDMNDLPDGRLVPEQLSASLDATTAAAAAAARGGAAEMQEAARSVGTTAAGGWMQAAAAAAADDDDAAADGALDSPEARLLQSLLQGTSSSGSGSSRPAAMGALPRVPHNTQPTTADADAGVPTPAAVQGAPTSESAAEASPFSTLSATIASESTPTRSTSAQASSDDDEDEDGNLDIELENLLDSAVGSDNLLASYPAPTAAVNPGAVAASEAPEDDPERPTTMLQAIQSALKAGVDPDELKRLIDQAQASIRPPGGVDDTSSSSGSAGNRRRQRSDAEGSSSAAPSGSGLPVVEAEVIEQHGGRGGPSSSRYSSGSSNTAESSNRKVFDMVQDGSAYGSSSTTPATAAAEAKRKLRYGPSPPTPQDAVAAAKAAAAKARTDEPLLNVRPEVQRAMAAGANVKYLDLNKLPSKYRKQMREQQEQQRAAAAAAAAAAEADAGAEDDEGAADDDEEQQQLVLGVEHLREMREAAAAQGLDMKRLLAEALRAGMALDEQAVAELGLQPEVPDGEYMLQLMRQQQQEEQQQQQEEGSGRQEGEAEEVEGLAGDRWGSDAEPWGEDSDARMAHVRGSELGFGGQGEGVPQNMARSEFAQDERGMLDKDGYSLASASAQPRAGVDVTSLPSPGPASANAPAWGAGLRAAAAKRRGTRKCSSRDASSGGGSDIKSAPGAARAAPRTAAAGGPRTLTQQELRDIAARQGLDFERLLADARAKGVEISGA